MAFAILWNMKYSTTFAGLLAALLGQVLQHLGLDIAPGDLETTVGVLLTVFGLLWAAWGRWRRGDVTLLGFKK